VKPNLEIALLCSVCQNIIFISNLNQLFIRELTLILLMSSLRVLVDFYLKRCKILTNWFRNYK